jgi:hypothetical protein
MTFPAFISQDVVPTGALHSQGEVEGSEAFPVTKSTWVRSLDCALRASLGTTSFILEIKLENHKS